MSLFLSNEELRELTGRRQPAAQRRWLQTEGWVHALDADGRPRVSRAYAQRKLGGTVEHREEPRLRLP